MPKYRKKPVVIEAIQVTLENKADLLNLGYGITQVNDTLSIQIPTLEGEMTAGHGDWIITGVKGERYPCKDDIFQATYEPEFAEEGAS